MDEHNHQTHKYHNFLLASDLDGTLIPLDKTPENVEALQTLKSLRTSQPMRLIFVTGRHLESVAEAVQTFRLPMPDWIICDVGTSIYTVHGDTFQSLQPYHQHLNTVTQGLDRAVIEQQLQSIDGLELQDASHQRDFKVSYYCPVNQLEQTVQAVVNVLAETHLPYNCLGSVDPFANRGLVDVLPARVDKAYALQWLADFAEFAPEHVIYAGDSGNDTAALTCGVRSILVGNAAPALRAEIQSILARKGIAQQCYFAQKTATSGVLEGIHHHVPSLADEALA